MNLFAQGWHAWDQPIGDQAGPAPPGHCGDSGWVIDSERIKTRLHRAALDHCRSGRYRRIQLLGEIRNHLPALFFCVRSRASARAAAASPGILISMGPSGYLAGLTVGLSEIAGALGQECQHRRKH